MNNETIRYITALYGIKAVVISDVIDSSRDENDIRLVYKINNQYVLHCCTTESISEKFLQDINRLVKRHKDIGVWAPELFPLEGSSDFLCEVTEEGRRYHCYMEELAPFSVVDEDNVDFYEMKEHVLPFLGKLASRYSGVDLSEIHSMWSIIDLSPFDNEIDEKQENINILCEALERGDSECYVLAERIRLLNEKARDHIKEFFDQLPRCVFQGDLNPTNILVDDENNFKGIIDFNMFGTEVNINCFLNESMYFLEKEDFADASPSELIGKIDRVQGNLMKKILAHYELNEAERVVYEDYNFVINVGFYPNVMLMVKLLKQGEADKVIEFLKLLCDRYQKYFVIDYRTGI